VTSSFDRYLRVVLSISAIGPQFGAIFACRPAILPYSPAVWGHFCLSAGHFALLARSLGPFLRVGVEKKKKSRKPFFC
jgi:hypothetical protein